MLKLQCAHCEAELKVTVEFDEIKVKMCENCLNKMEIVCDGNVLPIIDRCVTEDGILEIEVEK